MGGKEAKSGKLENSLEHLLLSQSRGAAQKGTGVVLFHNPYRVLFALATRNARFKCMAPA